MAEATTVLFSRDAALIERVREIVQELEQCRVVVHDPAAATKARIKAFDFDVAIVHVQDSAEESLVEMLMGALGTTSACPVLAVTETHSLDQIRRLLSLGVMDCLTRPLDLRRLAFLVDALTLRIRFQLARHRAGEQETPGDLAEGPVGRPASGGLKEHIHRVAEHDTCVLITGETGAGKTRLARSIHELSPRRGEPFLGVDCGTLPEHLIESELFGHRKGAFTGATSDRTGRFSAAGRGTLFLDEIDTLPLAAQCKLLRAIDERVFEPVGSDEPVRLEARLVVASNRDLQEEVAAGRFRSDLYYRLNVVELHVPPLRQRREEIRPLARKFFQESASRNGRAVPRISEWVFQTLETYHWPGNIRELRNVAEHAVTFCGGEEIRLVHLPHRLRNGQPGREADAEAGDRTDETAPTERTARGFGTHLSELALARARGEVERIREVLRRTGNNRSQAARELGISRPALYKKLRKYGLMNAGSEH